MKQPSRKMSEPSMRRLLVLAREDFQKSQEAEAKEMAYEEIQDLCEQLGVNVETFLKVMDKKS